MSIWVALLYEPYFILKNNYEESCTLLNKLIINFMKKINETVNNGAISLEKNTVLFFVTVNVNMIM